MLNTPGGRDLLVNKYKLRNVPVVARGDRYVFGQQLEDVAEFVGLHGTGLDKLSPEQLFEKYRIVFATAQRLVRQLPSERIDERVIPNRDRSIRFLSHHMFRIAEAFLEAWDGVEYSVGLANIPPGDEFRTGAQIADYGAKVWTRLEGWWKTVDDRTLARKMKTYYGEVKAHNVFERSTWHSAQHCRQMAAVLERFGITPDQPLTAEQLAGLPLPERLWE